jgi:transposase
MHDRDTRAAVLLLHGKGHALREIARSLDINRASVRKIIRSSCADVPDLQRAEKAAPIVDQIRALHAQCEGNLVRVQEKLADSKIELAYSTLSGYCRRHDIGVEPKQPVGTYCFSAGQEMQHDTSPHRVQLGDRKRTLHCASLVLCHSRRIFAQGFPVWNRFWAKVFLTEALVEFDGAAEQCMLDNASILVAAGTGNNAIIAPEMVAFGKRFGFVFAAHELGDVNRSARVERPFWYIERNFYPGRTFADVDDVNAQLRAWCKQRDLMPKRVLGNARPIDLFVAEHPALRRLPLHVPEPYRTHDRTVDERGFVNLESNRYSVPAALIDRKLSIHESSKTIKIYDGHRLVCLHDRQQPGLGKEKMLEEHKRERERYRLRRKDPEERPTERAMRTSSKAVGEMVDELRRRHGGRATRIVERLHRMWLDYPLEPLEAALTTALAHGLFDLRRIEALVLQHVAGDYFRLPDRSDDEDDRKDNP